MHTAKLTRPGSAPMKALGHPERALAPLLLGNVRLGQHLLFGLEDEGENTQMFDLAPQAENAVVAEAGPSAGERALMRAVLEDAIRCLTGEAGPVHQRTRLAAEARSWIEASDPRWPYSFENLCDGLGLDAANLRRRLLRDAPAPALPAAPASMLPDARQQPGGRGVRPRRETPAECDIAQMIRKGRPLRVVAQTFGISISKASILSCGLASRMKAERDDEIRRLRAEGWTHRALAAHFELSRIRIIRICRQDDDAPVLHREPKQVGKRISHQCLRETFHALDEDHLVALSGQQGQ